MDRRPTHILLLKAARALELTIAAVILVVIVCGAVFLFWQTRADALPLPGGILSGGLPPPAPCCW